MNRERLSALWATHRTLGVVLGTLIFIIFVTGTLCTFRDELRLWSSPVALHEPASASPAPNAPRIQQVLERFAAHHPLEQAPRWALFLPLYPEGAYELIYRDPKRPALVRAFVGGENLDYLGESNRNPGEFLFNIHANLSLRGKLGRVSVGLVGLASLMLVITGILIHQHKVRNAFTFRPGQTRRKTLGDLHRVLGLWGLLFFGLMSFTGAVLGLKSLLVVVPTAVQYRGDLAKAKKELASRPPRRSGQVAAMQASSELWTKSLRAAQDLKASHAFVPTMVSAIAWGDAQAQWVLAGSLVGALAPQNEAVRVTLSGVSGELLHRESVLDQAWPERSFSALAPLHYGDFGGDSGGWPLKTLYFVFGLAGVGLVASGLMIWAQRKDPQRKA